MDPVSAFSLAGTILQFIDSGSKFIGLAWKLYRTENGGSKTLSELTKLTKNLDQVLDHLASSSSNPQGQHSGISELADDCQAVGNHLLDLLQKLLVNKPRKRDALKAAFQMLWNEDEIRSLQLRLDGFRAQFNLHLLVSLR